MPKLYVSTDHPGHWPVGTASIVIAPDEEHAREFLAAELEKRGLVGDFTLRQLPIASGVCEVLRDGDY